MSVPPPALTLPDPQATRAAIIRNLAVAADDLGVKRVPRPLRSDAVRDIADAVITIVDPELADLLCSGWSQLWKLQQAARRTAAGHPPTESVALGPHEITWHEDIGLQVRIDNAAVDDLALSVEFIVEVPDSTATVRAGRVVGLAAGTATLHLDVSLDNQQILHEQHSLDLDRAVEAVRGVQIDVPSQ